MSKELQEAIILLMKASLHCNDQETIDNIDDFIFNMQKQGEQ